MRTRKREMSSDAANHHEILGVREFCVRVNLPSPIWQVHVPIQLVLIPIGGLSNPMSYAVPLISCIHSNPPHCSHHHPTSVSLSSTTPLSSQYTKLSHSSLSLYAMIMNWHWVQYTPSITYTNHSIYRVQHPPMIGCLPYISMITSEPLNLASASSVPPYRMDCHRPKYHESLKVQRPCQIPTFASQLTVE